MKKIFSILVLALFGLILGACSSQDDFNIPAKQPLNVDAIVKSATGFTAGNNSSPKIAYVFFDAQCPHCGHLWEISKPLWGQVNFVWIPVAFLNRASLFQGTTLLTSGDPVASMDEHETSLLAKQGGIVAGDVSPEQRKLVERNTKLLSSFGADSIPYVVTRAPSGELVSLAGAGTTEDFAKFLGVPYGGTPGIIGANGSTDIAASRAVPSTAGAPITP